MWSRSVKVPTKLTVVVWLKFQCRAAWRMNIIVVGKILWWANRQLGKLKIDVISHTYCYMLLVQTLCCEYALQSHEWQERRKKTLTALYWFHVLVYHTVLRFIPCRVNICYFSRFGFHSSAFYCKLTYIVTTKNQEEKHMQWSSISQHLFYICPSCSHWRTLFFFFLFFF